jgi:ferredoxin/flavodoxin
MTAIIYYFSSTGNSLYTAKKIAQKLDGTIANIASFNQQSKINNNYDVVGFVFPIYYQDMPGIVRDFAGKLEFTGKPYIFAVATFGSLAGFSLYKLNKILHKVGVELSAGFTIKMPENYVGTSDLTQEPEEAEPILKAADEKIELISKAVYSKEKHPFEGSNNLLWHVLGGGLKSIDNKILKVPKKIKATDNCTACGICRRVCPTDNITITEKTAVHGDNCEECFACYHWCPAGAVYVRSKGRKTGKYRNPSVKAPELFLR